MVRSPPDLIRILTVDDLPLLPKGIAALINGEPDLKLVAEESDGKGHRCVPISPAGCNLDRSSYAPE
jgi:hypothetical protein